MKYCVNHHFHSKRKVQEPSKVLCKECFKRLDEKMRNISDALDRFQKRGGKENEDCQTDSREHQTTDRG